MYLRWAKNHKLQADLLSIDDTETGISSAIVRLSGSEITSRLSSESGLHRLCRVSPYDKQKRRHTSFALVEIYPEAKVDSVVMNPKDVRMDVFRGSGAGGQHRNKTSSAVRLTHIPTGVTATCQSERSQHQNRENAWRVLQSRLAANINLDPRALLETRIDVVRTYTLYGQALVVDHQTGKKSGAVERILDGELDLVFA